MRKCKLCGEEFDVIETQKDFDYVTALSYMKIKPDMCFRCALEAVETKAKGVYFETCDRCGEEFDLFEDEERFENAYSTFEEETLEEQWQPLTLCSDCALEKINGGVK